MLADNVEVLALIGYQYYFSRSKYLSLTVNPIAAK